MSVEEVKMTTRTSSGTLIRVPATLEYVDGRIYFLKSPFSLKDEIKAMGGSRWHQFQDEGRYAGKKIWSVDDNQRNRFQLRWLCGEDVYAWFDRPLIRHVYRPLFRNGKPEAYMPHQADLSDAGLTYHYQIFAAEMGCVDGEAVVHVNRAGKGFKISLAELCRKFHGGQNRGRVWDRSIPTFIRSLCGDTLQLNRVVNVLAKGRQPVVRLTLASGRSVRVTPDHEICVGYDRYKRADQLHSGDTVLTDARGGLVSFVPRFDTVVSVEADGEADVYDVVCADPHRNFVADGVVVHNCGKTLAAQMVMELSGAPLWWWVGPKTSLSNIKRELRLWGFPAHEIHVEFFTYEGLVRVMDEWNGTQPIPFGLVADESSRCKNCTSQRSKACQKLADLIRETHGLEKGYVIEMSGTPSPKTPVDWWSQAEIAWPGFLKEGSHKAMEERLAFMVQQNYDGHPFKKRIGWKDSEQKCAKCGETREEGPHALDECDDPDDYHPFTAAKNEVAYLYERLKGLAVIKHKRDCLHLPEKRYRKIICKPTPSTMRVAQAIANSAPNAVTGMTLLRELSDGFQYREIQDGMTPCTHCTDGMAAEWSDPNEPDKTYADVSMLDPELVARLVKSIVPCPVCGGSREVAKIVRVARETPCPKDAALKALLEESEETGRIVVFAGFTGSVDRIVKLCLGEKWSVVRCDQGNFQVFAATSDSPEGRVVTDEEPLDYWANMDHGKVAFVANPESGGMSLTLVEARMAVYWSNSWKPEFRVQSEDRIHRKGMDENLGCTIVDLIHLPSDERVLSVIRANRKLELMTMGEILEGVDWNDTSEDGERLVEEAVS